MIKKFKCIACGKAFEADEMDYIVCPKCHSDNVTPVKPNFIKPIGIVFALFLSIGAGMFVTKQFKGSVAINSDLPGDTIVPSPSPEPDISIPVDPKLAKIEIQNSKPVYDKATKSYSFSVSVKNVPEGAKVTYELCEAYDPQNKIKKVLMTSDDGKFKAIPASKNECSTYFVVVNAFGSDGQLQSSRDREIDGFEEVKPVTNRVTKAQLQSMINRRDVALQGGNSNISNSVTIIVNNLGSGENKPQSFQDVYNNLNFDIWSSVSVVDVGYDSENRVSKVILSVIHVE